LKRTYEYHGFTVEVTVETDFTFRPEMRTAVRMQYAAMVQVYPTGHAIAALSPLRFDTAAGRPFNSEADALMGGYSAGRRIVDDLFARSATAADSAMRALTRSK
jgi:hypothetical protein